MGRSPRVVAAAGQGRLVAHLVLTDTCGLSLCGRGMVPRVTSHVGRPRVVTRTAPNGSPCVAARPPGLAEDQRHCKPSWIHVILELEEGPVIEVRLTDSFWRNCSELRSAELGRWQLESGRAPWPKHAPPRIAVNPIGDNRFHARVLAQHNPLSEFASPTGEHNAGLPPAARRQPVPVARCRRIRRSGTLWNPCRSDSNDHVARERGSRRASSS